MATRRAPIAFLLANVLMWALMTAILVVVPDQLEHWIPIAIARVIGWAIASGLWVAVLQQHWRARVGPFTLFAIQLVLWLSAALVAIWISDSARPF